MKLSKRKKTVSAKLLLMAAFLAAAAILGALMLQKYLSRQPSPTPPPVSAPRESPATIAVTLFFASPDSGELVRETREIDACGNELSVCVRDTLQELANGPLGDLAPTIPANSTFRSVSIHGDTALVNLGKECIEGLPQGSSAELTAAYSIVNTIALNFPAIKQVAFQVEGRDISTFNGHLDLRKPLVPDFRFEQKRR